MGQVGLGVPVWWLFHLPVAEGESEIHKNKPCGQNPGSTKIKLEWIEQDSGLISAQGQLFQRRKGGTD